MVRMTGEKEVRALPASWTEAIARYLEFRSWPSWRGRDFVDGKPAPDHLEPEQCAKLEKQLSRWVHAACAEGLLPESLRGIEQRHIDELVTKFGEDPRSSSGWMPDPRRGLAEPDGQPNGKGVKRKGKGIWREHLFRLIVLDRGDYTCEYCGRNAGAVHKAEKRTLRLEIDHRDARSKSGLGWSLANITVACRSCNVMMGQLDRERFIAELRSLAAAVAAKYR